MIYYDNDHFDDVLTFSTKFWWCIDTLGIETTSINDTDTSQLLWEIHVKAFQIEASAPVDLRHDRRSSTTVVYARSRLGCVVSSQIGGVWCWICVGCREVCHEFFGLGMLPEDDAEVILLESVEFNRKHQLALEWYVVLWVCFKHGGAVQFDKWNYSTVVVDFERSSWSFHLCIYDFKLDL